MIDSGVGHNSHGRGRGGRRRGRGRNRGRKSQRRVTSSRAESGKRSTSGNGDRIEQVLEWKGKPRGRGGRGRGRRSIRSRQRSTKVVLVGAEREDPKEIIIAKSPSGLVREGWNEDETIGLQVEDTANTSSSERSGSEDENGLAMGDEYDDMVTDEYVGYNGRSRDLLRGTYYNIEVEENEVDDAADDNEEGDAEDDQGDLDVEEYINGDSDEEVNGDGDGEQNLGQDQGAGFTSSEYSE